MCHNLNLEATGHNDTVAGAWPPGPVFLVSLALEQWCAHWPALATSGRSLALAGLLGGVP